MFHAFPVLEELELSLNGIVDISLEPGYLASLHRLDLSYNSLSEGALLALGTLPLLKELHLTGQCTLEHNIITKFTSCCISAS